MPESTANDQQRTPAADAPTDHVLHVATVSGEQHPPVHLPKEDDPDEARCGSKRHSGNPFIRTTTTNVNPKWKLCCHCDPNYKVPRPNGGPKHGLAAKLIEADPDDVGRPAPEVAD